MVKRAGRPPRKTRPKPEVPRAPAGFRVDRTVAIGRHPILEVFPGLDRLDPARRIETDSVRRTKLFGETSVEVVDQDMWMYVAPREAPRLPANVRRRWQPVIAPGTDCVVVGAGHLRESSELVLFMDIFHELCHVLQRRDGANLWEPGVGYTKRWTEIEAYRFVVAEGRSLGVSDSFLREYLRVEWISDAEHRELLAELGVAAP